MKNGLEIRIQCAKEVRNSYLSSFQNNLTSSTVQCKFKRFLVLFWNSGQLGVDRTDKISRLIKNGYEIPIQHDEVVINSNLWDF